MKILQIFGAVVAVHLLAFILIFASPGCQSPTNIPTPDATMPTASAPAPVSFNTPAASPQPVDLGTSVTTYTPTSDHATPTRPGSPAAAAVTPAKPAAEVAPISTYTVGKGDSLWTIAKKNELSVSELAKANRISTGTVLKPGQKLIIPGKPGQTVAQKEVAAAIAASAPEKPAAPRANGESVKHTVMAGESLGTIARKYQVKTGDLAAANNITDPSKVRAGQSLIIPGYTAVANKPKPAASTTKAPASPETPAAAAAPAAETPSAAAMTPRFDIKAPPVGQDLDAGLKEATTEVPTIKVEEPKQP
jgi:LysM repeat protein